MGEVREGLIKGGREVGEGTDGRREGFAEEMGGGCGVTVWFRKR